MAWASWKLTESSQFIPTSTLSPLGDILIVSQNSFVSHPLCVFVLPFPPQINANPSPLIDTQQSPNQKTFVIDDGRSFSATRGLPGAH